MSFLTERVSKYNTVTVRASLWIAIGAAVFILIENEALKNDLSAQAITLINEMELDEDYIPGTEYSVDVTASHSHLVMGKGVGNLKIYSRKPAGESDYEYYMLSYFYEQESNKWTNMATFGYEDIDARDGALKAFSRNS